MNLTKNNIEKLSTLEKIANGAMWWIGSIPSLIAHTIFFIISFALPILGIVDFDKMLLVLTTVVSLEAIYLAIFIQMSVNRSSENIEDLKEDVEIIQEDIDEIQEDIEEINEEEDEEDHNERAKNVMLKSNVSSNKNEIKALKVIISQLQNEIDQLKKDDKQTEE